MQNLHRTKSDRKFSGNVKELLIRYNYVIIRKLGIRAYGEKNILLSAVFLTIIHNCRRDI